MKEDIDRLISDTDEEIEKLKILKDKQEELKQLQNNIGIGKNRKKKISLKTTPRIRKLTASLIVFCMIMSVAVMFVSRVEAANPVVVYTDPANDGRFADTNDGAGVSWTVNVSDADTNLQWVKLYANDSGSWVLFYDSGALGGVAYHNVSGQNGNWTGSWTEYYWNISANDGTTHDTTYSFTTGYQWGDPQMAHLDDVNAYSMGSAIYKNATGEYYMALHDNTGYDVEVMTSNTATNWSLVSSTLTTIDSSIQSYYPMGVWGWFTYNNEPAFFYCDAGNTGYWTIAHYDGSSWTTTSTGISGGSYNPGWMNHQASIGADIVYYNGQWQIVCGVSSPDDFYMRLYHYSGTPWSTWSGITYFDSVYVEGSEQTLYSPSLVVFNGTLHLIYRDSGDDLHWETYDGASWTDKGDIEANIATGSMVKDPVNNQIVCVYINSSGDIVYRVTDNLTSWSEPHLVFAKDYTFAYPHLEYIDQRLVIGVSYNIRGNYNVYTISSPSYSSKALGLNQTLNRIQWPDASPGDTNVNSTVFSMKNLDNRDIKTITWHFEDIGEITNASNIKLWTNMSGAWTNIGTTGADGNIATLDISGLMNGGGEWIPGQTIYWKAEILAVGDISEDIHSTDEDIFYKITF